MKARVFTNRRAFLLAKGQDTRCAYEAECTVPVDGCDPMTVTLYGLANTEHQFRLGIVAELFQTIRKLSARDIQTAMAEELAALAGGK